MAKYITELLGTFFLVLIIGLAVMSGMAMAPLAIGGGLMVLVYMGGHISGAHYNPAVTVAAFIRGKTPAGDVVPYMAAQVIGAVLASFAVRSFYGPGFAPAPGEDVGVGAAVLAEFLFTFLLVLVILHVATSPRTEGNSHYGLSIGGTLMVAAFVGGPISGAVLNPAVGIGPNVVDLMDEGKAIGHLWIYIVVPIAAGIAAPFVYRLQHGSGD